MIYPLADLLTFKRPSTLKHSLRQPLLLDRAPGEGAVGVGGRGRQSIPLGHWEPARRAVASGTGPAASYGGDGAGGMPEQGRGVKL